jgi:aryl-alcohol dehydrogenase-like predicted oxidoreductase
MLDRHIEQEIMPTCRKHGLGLTVWSPLAEGVLTGKYNDGFPDNTRGLDSEFIKAELTEVNIQKLKKLNALAGQIGASLARLALAWILRRPEISCAIVGASKEAQLKENIDAAELKLSEDTLSRIDAILDGP